MSYTSAMFWRRNRLPEPGFLVFGLGNPGVNYARTRHNIGWWVLDELARRHGVTRSLHRHRGQADYTGIKDVETVLVKPTTFMNRSGACIAAWKKEYPEAGFVVVHDDISLSLGKLRLRRDGSSGGNKGIQSIIDTLRTEQFDRIKLGVGDPGGGDAADYVLEIPSDRELDRIQPAVAAGANVVEALVSGGHDAARDVIAQFSQNQLQDNPAGQEK